MAQPSTTLVILGASGDLTNRLLLPGLATLLRAEPRRRVEVVGTDLAPLTEGEWQRRVRTALEVAGAQGAAAKALLRSTRYVQADATDPAALATLLASIPAERIVLYFALPPQVTRRVCEALATLEERERLVLAIEKPFGSDLATASDLNALVTRIVPEERVFRIDHFLGLYTVLNLIGLRFANRILEPSWNREGIERVEIHYDETVTLEGRAGYYDRAGALRDMIQSHLLQVMAILAMEPVASVAATPLRDAIGAVLRQAEIVDPVADAKRARYTAGAIGEREVPDYLEEEGVDAAAGTETLAQLTVHIRNQRWAGVPFVLRSGKALGQMRKQAVVHFRPDEFELALTTNGGGDPFTLERTELRGELGGGQLEPYGEVLASILDGDPRLSVRGDAAEECWRIVEPVLEAWQRDAVPMAEYRAGSKGPRGWRTNG